MPYNSDTILVEEYSSIHLPISCKKMFTYAFTRTRIRIAIYMYPHVCIHVRRHIHTCVYMHICVYADMHVLGCDERFSSASQRKALPKTGQDSVLDDVPHHQAAEICKLKSPGDSTTRLVGRQLYPQDKHHRTLVRL